VAKNQFAFNDRPVPGKWKLIDLGWPIFFEGFEPMSPRQGLPGTVYKSLDPEGAPKGRRMTIGGTVGTPPPQ